MTRLSEDDAIATLFAPLAGRGAFGLRDDAAILSPPPDHDIVVTADAIVAGIHFFADDPPDAIAAKALGVNLSDLAAKAAAPSGFVTTLALPDDLAAGWLPAYAAGLGAGIERFSCPLLGGDMVRTPGPLTISITAFGFVPRGTMLPRTGAQAGDALYVTGTIGDAALGLQLRLLDDPLGLGTVLTASLDETARTALLDRYLRPAPRLGLRAALRAHAHAGMDVSDGLVGDLSKMLRVSGVTGRIDVSRVPLSAASRDAVEADPRAFATALTGGDDYELLVAVPPASSAAFEHEAAAVGIAVTRIGTVVDGQSEAIFHDAEGRLISFERRSFSHF